MGVGASLFTRFLLDPPDDYDILAVQTPGRENRMAEPVAEHIDELLDHIVPFLESPHLDVANMSECPIKTTVNVSKTS